MTDIKPIETEYAGYKFRSRLEARWAVFFDACGVDWEYEPQGYTLQDGTKYLPDFLLHGVEMGLSYGKKNERAKDLYIEVKGRITDVARKKIYLFSGLYDYYANRGADDDYDPDKVIACIQRPTVAFGRIPDCDSFVSFVKSVQDMHAKSGNYLFTPEYVNGESYFGCLSFIPYINTRGRLALADDCPYGKEDEYTIYDADILSTLAAYKQAKQARFEWGETPRRCTVK